MSITILLSRTNYADWKIWRRWTLHPPPTARKRHSSNITVPWRKDSYDEWFLVLCGWKYCWMNETIPPKATPVPCPWICPLPPMGPRIPNGNPSTPRLAVTSPMIIGPTRIDPVDQTPINWWYGKQISCPWGYGKCHPIVGWTGSSCNEVPIRRTWTFMKRLVTIGPIGIWTTMETSSSAPLRANSNTLITWVDGWPHENNCTFF